jgi:hypothetical protein
MWALEDHGKTHEVVFSAGCMSGTAARAFGYGCNVRQVLCLRATRGARRWLQ